ncbi:heavy-metal-associated domain-containing protein [Patulibacter sp. NPDC049589]|uniref:heavy-metal-associated domain-containing protein n=1 Tax=Patulibacter sp. NPDC049589 TaxID=3154731 RepID=UPI003413379A
MSQTTETTYRVQGMTCGHCELSVREEVEELEGVQSAVADRVSGSLTVRGSAERDQIRQAVKTAGYTLLD